MSEKMGNGFPKMGNLLPLASAQLTGLSYAAAISVALRDELGGSHQAIKTLMRRTGASPRSAKNWLAGSVGPSGAHLVELMRTSDSVFEAVLRMSGRDKTLVRHDLGDVKAILRGALALLETTEPN